jgi:c-di-GMP-binding flagellar brake protein YcgR
MVHVLREKNSVSMAPDENIDDTEILYGKDLLRFFQELEKNKTVIKINLLGHDYERLTMVIGVLNKKPPYHLRIDYPNGFKRAVKDTSTWKIRFEFKGKDRLVYRFRTYGGYISGRDIFIPFPRHIERVQRRRYFRLEAPLGARMVVPRYAKEYEFSLLNLSEGGALLGSGKGSPRKPVFQEGDFLRHMSVLFISEGQQFRIPIQKAMIRRLDRDLLTYRYQYALQFVELGQDERSDLKELIYLFQRDFLKKRQKVEG